MGKAHDGSGTAYKETDPARRTKWRAEVTADLPNGRTKRVITRAMTKTEALDKLRARVAKLREANPDAQKMRVDQYLRKWLDWKKPQVKAATIADYENVLSEPMRELNHLTLAELQPRHISELLTKIQNRGEHAKAQNVRGRLRQALRQAERWELLTNSPARNIQPIKAPPPKRAVWEPHHIRAFLEHLPAAGHDSYQALLYTAIWTGMRRGELIALPWANVQPDRITVDRTHSRHGGEPGYTTPKTEKSNRVIPISGAVYARISASTDGTLAFPTHEGHRGEAGRMLGPSNVRRAFRAVIKAASVPEIRLHDLRRTAATLWARQGQPPKVIQRLLGHATPHLAMQIYVDIYEQDAMKAALEPDDVLGENWG